MRNIRNWIIISVILWILYSIFQNTVFTYVSSNISVSQLNGGNIVQTKIVLWQNITSWLRLLPIGAILITGWYILKQFVLNENENKK